MSIAFSIGLSGMQAAQVQLGVSAHHIANLATADLQRRQVASQSLPAGGVRTEVQSSAGMGEDLARDLVQQRQARHLYVANLRTVQAADHLLGTLLDTFT